MPLGAIPPPPAQSTSGLVSSRLAAPARLTSFPPYEVADDSPRSETPETITVMRTKKRGTGQKKSIPLTSSLV